MPQRPGDPGHDESEGVTETKIDVVFQPQWTPQLITPEGRQILGMEDEGGE